MPHIDDIEDALDSKDLRQIEAAFCQLVQWPDKDTIDGVEDARDLACLLDRVTAALEADRTAMPENLVDCIMTRSGHCIWLQGDKSYAAGARAVAAKSEQWQVIFDAGLPSKDEGQSAIGCQETV